MTKKRKTKKTKKRKVSLLKRYQKLFYILIFTTLVVFSAFAIYSNLDSIKTLFKEKKQEKKVYPNRELLDKINKMLNEERKRVDILKRELKREKERKKSISIDKKKKIAPKKIVSSEALDYKKSLENNATIKAPKIHYNLSVKSQKPLLAIIIDDVSFASEVQKIKSLPFKVTPSLLPPTKRHPNTPALAREFEFYMVHLPLEALNYAHPEPKTLLTTDTNEHIDNRLQNIKKWFPRGKFLNNHTGSKFTSNLQAMTRLFSAFDKNGLIFVDSRTTANSVASKVAKKLGKKLLNRDIFIDNIADISYIQNQLKKAIKKAKAKGFAIAIGHPHPKTLQALKISKSLFKDVKLVYIGTIYEKVKTDTK